MKKTYYRSEYSDKQWKALIDKAAELGCQVTYGQYGDRAEIDSTDRENAVLQSTGKSVDDCEARSFWAKHIHQVLQESTDLRKWKVQPESKQNQKIWFDHIKTFNSEKAAREYAEIMEYEIGVMFIIIPEQ